MSFEPIAIVGRACTLPEALTPQALWANVLAGKSCLSAAPPERWGLSRALALSSSGNCRDSAWSDVGGYVRGFDEVFDPQGFALPAEQVLGLDPLFRWVLHGVREALQTMGHQGASDRAGLVLGNLSFPSAGMSRFAESVWMQQQPRGSLPDAAAFPRPHAFNRFSSGLPAHLAAKAVGLRAGALAIDAACASSLYAIKLACDRLHDGSADVMVAGAVNGADDLFLHVGFSALSALSRSGQSRPFHRDADGLVPAEGAGFVVLKRLSDAITARDRILGVIRAVGLSNDGRGRGLLAPAEEGQERAMRQAYLAAGLSPADISLLECHATGTVVGDATEVRSATTVFAGQSGLPIGSLKSNLGHLITAAGVAALLKVLGAMEAGVRPATLHADVPIDALAGTPLRLLSQPEPWTGPRRAALSAFGFGGNNAHLIVEAWDGEGRAAQAPSAMPRERVAIVGVGARVGTGDGVPDFARELFDGASHRAPRGEVSVALDGLRFPPKDLMHVLPQQLLVLEAAREAVSGLQLPRERTSVLVGMGCDPEVARYGARWRVAGWAEQWAAAAGGLVDAEWLAEARLAFRPVLESAGVVGTMPNIVANRLNGQLDLAGPSFSVSAEEASGTAALELCARALATREIDAAIVGAVDLSHEPVHQTALEELGRARPAGDAAVVLVLKRLADARADGNDVLAILDPDATPDLQLGDAESALNLSEVFGSAHAASGLLHVAAAALALRYALRPRRGAPAQPWLGERTAEVTTSPLEAPSSTLRLRGADVVPWLAAAGPAPRSSGPELRLPAHPPLPRLPPFLSTAETMRPAPHLPPVMDAAPGGPEHAAALVAAMPAPLAPPRALPSVSTPTASRASRELTCPALPAPGGSPMAQVLAGMSAHRAQLASNHAEYIESQAAIHSRFLALRQAMEANLLGGYRAALQGLAFSPPPAALGAVAFSPPPATLQLRTEPPPVAPTAIAARALPGPKLSRADLEIMAGGRISTVLGREFEPQDAHARQVRMPEPPLLLADRVTGIDAVPLSMGTGTIWTETDILRDSWYLDDQGRMPAGVMIESGQADLLLIGWLGADMQNRGERVYRLLGCELTYHGGLCVPGDTLVYDIHVDGHAAQGDVRLFFFHYDCRVRGEPRLTVRHGQAGFFSDQELEESAGVLWDARSETPSEGPLDPPAAVCQKKRLSQDDLRAFAAGRSFDCFGPGWERTKTHVRTPRITGGRMLFLDEVAEIEPRGGPWGRGYLRAETTLSPDDWFFDGHFKNDPCMPGTLMFEGCLQAMAVYLAALGFTIERDGWRFEPVPEEKYLMRCRGQATPASRRLTYEVFVSELSAGPVPTVFADLLCTVDGRKAFHAKRVGLRLTPDWPLSHWRQLGPHVEQETGTPLALRTLGGLRGHVDPRPVAVVGGFAFGYDSLLACAWGPPSEAFGPFYSRFDGTRRVARLPGPPYHFMSRVAEVDEPIGSMQRGTKTEIEYDVPSSCWYFEESGHPTMPFAVLLEAALQPCGWLASYVGSALTTDVDLLFRNLDGVGTQLVEMLPTSGTLRTKVELTNVSQSAGMIIESFKVQCLIGEQSVYEMTTVFGFFPKEAFDNQVGLPVTDAERARVEAPSDVQLVLDGQPAKYFSGTLRLPGPMLLMLDRVTACAPGGGRAGLGYVRAEKDVDVDEWFFKAHFFQDPVQPGSLGIEALIQLLQFYMLERGMGDGIANPRFEPLMIGRPLTWKYRGQVVPKNEKIITEIEITEVGEDEGGRYAICDGWLWVDGKRIYLAKNMGMRIVAGEPAAPRVAAPDEERLDPASDRWLADHRPTWTVPALPMMSMVDRLVGAAARHGSRTVAALSDVRVHRWLAFPAGEIRLRTEVSGDGDEVDVALLAWREAPDKALSRFEQVATARASFAARAEAEAFAPLTDLGASADPYSAGTLFHGPAFQYLTSLRTGRTGATATLAAERGSVPRGTLHQGLLDAATHAIPHDALGQWTPDVPADQVAYPYRIPEIVFHAPLPDAGEVRVEARFAGFEAGERFPAIDLQLIAGGRVRVSLRLVEVLLPKGPIGQAPPEDRTAFLRDRRHVAGLGLSSFDGSTTRLAEADVRQSDWLPGTVAGIYGIPHGQRGDMTTEVAVREHVARRAFVHPSALVVDADLSGATAAMRPLRHHLVRVTRDEGNVLVADASPPAQDLTRVREYWAARFGVGPWPVEDLYYGLIERFVGDVVVTDPAAYAQVFGKSCLYLGNHQVGVESLLFSIIASALSGTPTVTLAKAEHRTSWLGELIAHSFSYPGVTDPRVITFFDREDRESLMQIIGELAGEMKSANKSAMVHVEGTRALACREPVLKMSSAFIDMALAVGAPIVPIRFVGGLPLAALSARIEFPIGFGRQDYWIGKPILPEQLAVLPYKDRKATVLAAMNGLGPPEEIPHAPDPRFAALVDEWIGRTGATPEHAVLYQTLAGLESPGEPVAALLAGARRGELAAGKDEPSRWLAKLADWLFGPRGPRTAVER